MIVFLGNPGLKYRKTRHNVGFMMGDMYARANGVRWCFEKKFGADTAVIPGLTPSQQILLVKPQKFYNLTGEVVQRLAQFYKIPNSGILVVCDDLNLDFGTIRTRASGDDGGNNGLKSIIMMLGSKQFARVRIGTGNDLRGRADDARFVLAKFNRDETAKLSDLQQKTADIIDGFISGDFAATSYQT